MTASTRRYLILAVGTVLLLFLGLIYAYSVLMAPLKSEFAWSVSGMTLIFALSMISFTVGNLIAGKLVKTKGVRCVFPTSIAFLLVGFIGSSFAGGATSLLVIYAAYGIVASIGIGLVYNVVVPAITSWFPDKTGFAQGVCLMGYGFGGFLLGPVVTQVYAQMDWRLVLVSIGVVFSVLVFLSSVIIRNPTAEEVATFPARPSFAGRAENARAEEELERNASASEMVKSPVFFLLYAFLFLLGGIGMGITGIGRELPLSLGADDMTAAFFIGFVNIGSGIGRLCGGTLLDRLGRGRTMTGIGVLFLVAVLTMIGSLVLQSMTVQIVACLLSGISWGATIVTMPFVTRKEWGQRNMAENLAVVNSYGIFAAVNRTADAQDVEYRKTHGISAGRGVA